MSYRIVQPSSAEARNQVLDVWGSTFPHLDEARFDWAYERNPAGTALCWVARMDDPALRPIGSTALIKRNFRTHGRSVTAGISADFAVVHGHRGFGPALGLQRQATIAAEAGQVAFAYGLPNVQASSLIKRVGFRPVARMTEYVMPLRTRSVLADRIGRRGARVVSPVFDFALRARRAAHRWLSSSTDRHVDGDVFDARFDGLWEEVAGLQSLIIGERDARFLRWRFSYPANKYRTFSLLDRASDELQGYVTYASEGGSTSIVDMLCRDMATGFKPLLNRFAVVRERAGDTLIRVNLLAPGPAVQALLSVGFRPRGETLTLMIYSPASSAIGTAIQTPQNWWLTPADNDV